MKHYYRNEWSLTNGYPSDNKLNYYPNRVIGQYSMFSVNLQSNKSHTDQLCKSTNSGFRVKLHLPNEYPMMSKDYYRIQPDESVNINVRPVIRDIAPELKSMSPMK